MLECEFLLWDFSDFFLLQLLRPNPSQKFKEDLTTSVYNSQPTFCVFIIIILIRREISQYFFSLELETDSLWCERFFFLN